jgi:ubiquinone/menaquinone biosynthesis C-methylase UbiE
MQKTKAQILKHHGGNAEHARKMITTSYGRRHDEKFWQFWQQKVAKNHQEGDGIVDLGAGIGQFINDCANHYPSSLVYGIDAADYMVQHSLDLPNNAKLIQDDLHNPTVEIKDNSLSMVMANMVVHELTQPIKMFKATYSWLKKGGRFCVIDLVRQPLEEYLAYKYQQTSLAAEQTSVADLEDAFEHFLEHNRYHGEDIIYMLKECGFKLIEQKKTGRFIRILVEK